MIAILALVSCKKSFTAPQVMPEFPEVNLTPKRSGEVAVPESIKEDEIVHTTIGSSNTLVPRIQGKWAIKCAPPSFLFPFPHDRELSFSGSNFSESLVFYPKGSDCKKAQEESGKITQSGRLLVVDGTTPLTKVNLTVETATYLFNKEDSIFAHFKSLNSDLKLAQEKKSQSPSTLFTLMGVENPKLCLGSYSLEKNGLSEGSRAEALEQTGCLTLTP